MYVPSCENLCKTRNTEAVAKPTKNSLLMNRAHFVLISSQKSCC